MKNCSYVMERVVDGAGAVGLLSKKPQEMGVLELHAAIHVNGCKPCDRYLIRKYDEAVHGTRNHNSCTRTLYFLSGRRRSQRTADDARREIRSYLERGSRLYSFFSGFSEAAGVLERLFSQVFPITDVEDEDPIL